MFQKVIRELGLRVEDMRGGKAREAAREAELQVLQLP
jgi:hypothetical protein